MFSKLSSLRFDFLILITLFLVQVSIGLILILSSQD